MSNQPTNDELAKDINPSEDNTPDSLAEATTKPLSEDALGGEMTDEQKQQVKK